MSSSTQAETQVAPAKKAKKLKPARKQVKPGEVEIGIVSDAEDENPKTRGQWRVLPTDEVEKHLLAFAEKD